MTLGRLPVLYVDVEHLKGVFHFPFPFSRRNSSTMRRVTRPCEVVRAASCFLGTPCPNSVLLIVSQFGNHAWETWNGASAAEVYLYLPFPDWNGPHSTSLSRFPFVPFYGRLFTANSTAMRKFREARTKKKGGGEAKNKTISVNPGDVTAPR